MLNKIIQDIKNTSITSIDLQYNNIGAEGAIALAEALKYNTSVTSIKLSSNKIGDEGAIALAEALKSNTSVTSIALWKNNIGAEGARALAEVLKYNTSITSIKLSLNKIGDEGAIALADALKYNTSITDINLWRNNIGDEGARALADALKYNTSVTYINLWENNIGAEGAIALADALKYNTSLNYIGLDRNSIGSEGARALANALKYNTSITDINLWRNNIGDEGAIALADALKYNTSVNSIILNDNNIGDEGAIALADALKYNTSVTSINLEYNNIGAEGARALADALKYNTSVTSINLSGNVIGGEAEALIQEITTRNNKLFETNLNNIKQGKELVTMTPEAFLAILINKIKRTDDKTLKKEYQEIKAAMEPTIRLIKRSHPKVKTSNNKNAVAVEIPAEFQCSVTGQIMSDPVILTESGETYEREGIERWLLNHDTDPLTNERLANKNLAPNRSIKRSIVTFLDKHSFDRYPELWEEVYVPKQLTQQLLTALQSGEEQETRRLVGQAPHLLIKPDDQQKTLLHLICEQGNATLLQWSIKQLGEQFLQHPLTVEEDGAACFRSLVNAGKTGAARVWSQALNWSREDYEIELEQALKAKEVQAIESCIALGADANGITQRFPFIHLAIEESNSKLLEVLLKAGVSINKADNIGETPLHKAVYLNKPEMIKLIMDAKPDLNLNNREGKTALETALELKRYEAAKLMIYASAEVEISNNGILLQLISHGAENLATELLSKLSMKDHLNIKDTTGRTALLHASALGRTSIVQALINHGVSVETKDAEGNTALHLAAMSGQKETIAELLKHSAPAKALNHANQTPMAIAKAYGQTAIAEFIDTERRRLKLQPFIEPLKQEFTAKLLECMEMINKQQEVINRQQETIQGLQRNLSYSGNEKGILSKLRY